MSFKEFLKRLFPYLKNHFGKFIFVSIMMAFATVLEASIPEITGQIVDSLFTDKRSNSSSLYFSLILFLVILISSLFSLASLSASSWISNNVVMNIRVDMFSKLLKLPKSYFDKNTTGETLSKLTFDVEQISAASSYIWLDLIKSSLTVLILTGYLFYKNFLLSTSLIILMPLVYIAVKISTRRMRQSTQKVQESMGSMTHLLDENIREMI